MHANLRNRGCRADPASQAFDEALAIFKSELSKDKIKLQWIEDSKLGNLEEALAAVNHERTQYELRRGDSATRQCLYRLSERLFYYGNIMDVLIQQHPEYVSLVWGAMRFLVVISTPSLTLSLPTRRTLFTFKTKVNDSQMSNWCKKDIWDSFSQLRYRKTRSYGVYPIWTCQ